MIPFIVTGFTPLSPCINGETLFPFEDFIVISTFEVSFGIVNESTAKGTLPLCYGRCFIFMFVLKYMQGKLFNI